VGLLVWLFGQLCRVLRGTRGTRGIYIQLLPHTGFAVRGDPEYMEAAPPYPPPAIKVPTVSLALFHFAGWRKAWIFAQMGLTHLDMRADGLIFYKLVGTGSGVGFDLMPNFGRYAILSVWDSHAHAEAVLDQHEPHRRWHHAADHVTQFIMSPISSRGSWTGQTPFDPALPSPPMPSAPATIISADQTGASGGADIAGGGDIAVLTRATLKTSAIPKFWPLVPAISQSVAAALDRGDARFAAGLGEVPYRNQITFSVWTDGGAVADFARQNGPHGPAASKAMNSDWFSEYLFARFRLLDILTA